MNKIVYIDIGLQIWGGIGYLLAKILLATAESMNDSRKLRIAGWSSYLVSVPAWIILMVGKNDWLVTGTDMGSIPTMILGIAAAWKRDTPVPKFFDAFAKIITYLMIVLGFIYSIYYFHGIKTFTQILEILITIAFLLGSYLLAKQKPEGWLLYMLSGICMIILLLIQSKILLIFQQVISLIVEIIGYIKAVKKYKLKNNEN
jgi:hypothetical protein